MASKHGLKTLLRGACSRRRNSLFPIAPNSFSSGWVSPSQTHSSSPKLHTLASIHALESSFFENAKPKSSVQGSSEKRSFPQADPYCSRASFSTVGSSEGSEEGGSLQSLSLEESESGDDSDATSFVRKDVENVFWVPTTSFCPGRATSQGTERFAAKFPSLGKNYFRTFEGAHSERFSVSSVGIGTYLGTSEFRSGRAFQQFIRFAVENGLNIIDTSSHNLDQYSERVIGHTINLMIQSQQISRDELLLCSKVGFIPREHWQVKELSEGYLQRAFISKGLFNREDVSGKHCLAPAFLDFMLNNSRKNLGVECIDFYYLQNIENHIENLLDKEVFYERIKSAFEFLESACEENKIGHYGITCRNGVLTDNQSENFISLQRLVDIAESVGGENHHFKLLQTPYNLDSLNVLNKASQFVDGEELSPVYAAKQLGLHHISASSNYFVGSYKYLMDKLDPKLNELEGLTTPSKALQYTRTLPNLLTALISFRNSRNLEVLLKVTSLDS